MLTSDNEFEMSFFWISWNKLNSIEACQVWEGLKEWAGMKIGTAGTASLFIFFWTYFNIFQSILIPHKFCTCQNLFVTPKSILTALLWSFSDLSLLRAAQPLRCLLCVVPAEAEPGHALALRLSSPAVNKCSFCGLVSAMFSSLLYFLLVIY